MDSGAILLLFLKNLSIMGMRSFPPKAALELKMRDKGLDVTLNSVQGERRDLKLTTLPDIFVHTASGASSAP